MQNVLTKAEKAAASSAAKAAAQAPVVTPAPVATGLSLRAASNETHNSAGFTGLSYAGLSKPRNAGITKAPNTHTSKATPRTYAQLTERMHKTLAELAKSYGTAAFPLPGIDRGQAAIFLSSGFFVAAGEARAKLSPDTLKRYTKA